MRKSFLFGAAFVLSVASGCGDDGSTGTGGESTGGSSSGGAGAQGGAGTGAQGGAGTGAQGGGGSGGSGGSGGGIDNCTEITVDKLRANVLIFSGNVVESLGGAEVDRLSIELYPDNTPIAGAVDLGSNENKNYASCKTCVLVSEDNDAKVYFQDRGTFNFGAFTFTENDNEPQFLSGGSLTNLRLVEVTLDEDLNSTPVPNGACLKVTNMPIDLMAPPATWTCNLSAYDDGETCDCECEVVDPDCTIPNAPVEGCSGNQMCVAGLCQ